MEETLDIPMVELVPHDPPMMLLERLSRADDDTCTCHLTIREDDAFFENGAVPAFVGVEYMAQAVAAFAGYRARQKRRPPNVGFLLGSTKFSTTQNEFPLGQNLRVEVIKSWGDDELMNFTCDIIGADSESTIQEGSLNVFEPRDLDGYLKQATAT